MTFNALTMYRPTTPLLRPGFLRWALVLLAVVFAGLPAQQIHAAPDGYNLDNSLSLRHGTFLHPEQGAYVETWLNINGKALRYAESSMGRYQAQVEVTMVLSDGDEVVDYRKYALTTPEVRDTSRIDFAVVDQQRIMLPRPGLQLEMEWVDLNNAANTVSYTSTLDGDFSVQPTFSDVAFIEGYKRAREAGPFTRNGMELTPYAINFYPTERSELTFYMELYGTDAGLGEDQVLLTFSIRGRGEERINQNFWQYQKAEASAAIPVLRTFDITNLPTGNYELVAELRNTQNEVLLTKRAMFQRLNNHAVEKLENIAMLDVNNTWAQGYNAEQLVQCLDFLRPTAEPAEMDILEALKSNGDTAMQQRFLFNYWLKRDTVNPYRGWTAYLERIKEANDKFGTTARQGYMTDRGRVLLTYGAPNDLIARPSEPGAKPYEIWMYYTIDEGAVNIEQNNIRFIFYDPTLVSNNYQLIHSNAIGELNDPRWKLRVYGSSADPGNLNNFDNNNVRNSFGTNASQFEDDAGQGIFNDGP